MTNFLELTTGKAERLIMPLSAEAQAILTESGVAFPESGQIVLRLRDASIRERTQFEADQKGMAQTDTLNWLVSLLARRAEGNPDPAVLRELVQDLGPSEVAMLTHAYITGALPDPKVVQQAMNQTLIGMTNGLLGTLASVEVSPSSRTSTASNRGTSSG